MTNSAIQNQNDVEDKGLFVFIDESGNLDFGLKGTKHYVLAAVATTNPIASATALQELKYDYLKNAEKDIEFFHASEDRQVVRNEVLARIQNLDDKIKVHYIHVEKDKASPDLQEPTSFYSELGSALTEYIIKYKSEGFAEVIIIFDKCLRGNAQKAFLKRAKPILKKLGKPYRIYFHRTLSDFNGQIADYCAWAKYVSLERGEQRPMNALSSIEQTDHDLFANDSAI